ncbi:MAG TPA: tetratricopeptide repeat-containing sensor histidine kinase [Chryseolinea sp.]|nr:tetratricopeptide repeat-containing sensor histidine kinase [Chryseolinea sp.]
MRLAFRFAVIFFLLTHFSIAQKNEVDSIENYIRNAPADTAKVSLVNKFVSTLRDKDNNRALPFAIENVTLAENLQFKKGLGIAHENLGWIQYRRGDYTNAFDHFTKAMHISQERVDEAAIARCWIGIAAINFEQKQFDIAIEYFKKAYRFGKETDNYVIQARSLNNIAFAFLEMNQLDSAEQYAIPCTKISIQQNNSYLIGFANRTLGDISFRKKNFDKAIEYYLNALEMGDESKNIFILTSTNHRLAKAYLFTKQFEKAKLLATKNIALAKEHSYQDDLEKSYKIRSEIAHAQKNINDAFLYQSLYTHLHDSLYDTRNNEYLTLMQTRFDTEIKQAQIELLTRDTQLREEAYRQQKVWTYFFIGCLSLVLIMLFVFLYSNRLIRKAYSQLKVKNSEIYRQSEQLRNLNTTKDKLFSIIGHDLRSPVASLKGLMDIISLNNLSPKEFADVTKSLKRNLDSVYEDLDNLLLWAQTQLNGIHAVPEVVYIKPLVEEKISMFTESARLKEITLINEIEGDVAVWGDINQLKLIFRNLLNNAIKFNRAGGMIRIHLKESSEHVDISVTDSGVGIDSTDLGKLFNAETHFTRLGTKKEKGSGLGLLLTKEFVECNGGTITVTSELGKGSTFTFSLKRVFTEVSVREETVRSSSF